MKQSEIDALCDRAASIGITLNGKPAAIAGRLLPFGWICALDRSEKYEWSWEAISRTVNRDGKFVTKFV